MNSILKAATLFGIALVFVLSSVWLSALIRPGVSNVPSPTPIITPQARPLVECPSDFLSYTALRENSDRLVKLIDTRKAMFASDGRFINSEIVITKNETKESKVACGYLFVRAGTETNGPLQGWANIYINPNDFGGHINSKEQIGPGDGRNFSDYLFPLNKIQYWKTRADRVKNALSNADWAALLNVSETVSFEIALNTNDRSGFIDEVSVAYKCWNPITGEENTGCKLNITKAEDKKTNSPVQ